MSGAKSVTIQVGLNDLRWLEANGYNICVAKKIAGYEYDVVWQSFIPLPQTVFSWDSEYQIFVISYFMENAMVILDAAHTADVGLGEEITLDSALKFSVPTKGGPETGITLINQFGSTFPGISQVITGFDGKRVSKPAFVVPTPAPSGETVLTPVDSVLVWFQSDVQVGSMFKGPRPNAVEIDLAVDNSASWLYQNGSWQRIG